MDNRTKRALFGGVSMLLTSMAGVQAHAQAQASGDDQVAAASRLEEIVVTARKRTESLQNVPVAVSAISAQELQNHNVTDLAKLGELAPQVMIGRQTNGTGAILTIRGISSTSADAGLDQSVLVNIDGVQVSRGRIINAALFDVAQVEVLQGPQALFFGKNSPAGVISITSASPTSTREGYAKAGYEFNAREKFIEGAVSGPLTDTLKARLAVRGSWMDGYIKNLATPTASGIHPTVITPGATFGDLGPETKDYAGRLTLAWTPTEDFDATFKTTYGHQWLNSMSAYAEGFCVGTNQSTLLGRPLPQSDCQANQVKAETSLPPIYAANFPYVNGGVPYAKTNLVFSSLNMNKRLDKVTLTSTTGYYLQKYAGTNTADFSEWGEIWSSQHETFHLFTQELRANTELEGPVNFMAGGYLEHSARSWLNAADLFHGGVAAGCNCYASFITSAHGEADSYSFFGQLRWNIMENLELSGGARYSHDKKAMTFVNDVNGVTATPLRAQGVPLTSVYKGDNISPEVTLTWHPQDDQTLYAAYKTGYKAGGVSNGAILGPTATSESLKFAPEESKGFEAGYKAELLQHTLRFDVVAYRYNYDGLQLATFNPSTISFTIGNAAKARTEGVQGSLRWLATDDLSFNGNVGFNNAKYRKYETSQCYAGQTAALGCIPAANGVPAHQDLSGTRLVRAPKVTFNVGGSYRAHLPDGWLADLAADTTYSSSYQAQPDNAPGGVQDSFWRLNASVRVTPQDGKYEVSLIGRNLTNEYYMVSSVEAPGRSAREFTGIFNRPREVVLQVQYRF